MPARSTARTRPATRPLDPSTDEALLAQPVSTAHAPDMPVAIARVEWTSLAKLASRNAGPLRKLGITADKIATLARFAAQMKKRERVWQKAKVAAVRPASVRKRIAQAEALKTKLLEAGDWVCRSDEDGRAELAHIREGTGLADLAQDLGDLHEFWSTRTAALETTLASARDVALAGELAALLDEVATAAGADSDGAAALELRNRCFWGGDALASEVRAAGRYAFGQRPKVAAKFVSRYRATKQHTHRVKKSTTSPGTSAPPAADTTASAKRPRA